MMMAKPTAGMKTEAQKGLDCEKSLVVVAQELVQQEQDR